LAWQITKQEGKELVAFEVAVRIKLETEHKIKKTKKVLFNK
jgi:hypothetical protein